MTPRQVKVRAILMRAATELGVPDGYAPSAPKYREWAKARGYPSDAKLMWRTPGTGWTSVVRYAGLRPARELWNPARNRGKGPLPPMTREQLRADMIDDLRRVAREIGRPDHIPPPKTYRRLGRHHEREVVRNLGGDERSWFEVAASANLLPNRRRNGFWDRKRAITAYRQVARSLGRRPGDYGLTSDEIERHIASPRTLEPHVGRVNEFAVAAGYLPWPPGLTRKAALKVSAAEPRRAA